MNNALTYLLYLYNKFIDFVFNYMAIQTGVTVGWIAITCFVFLILFKNVLAVPRSGQSYTFRGGKDNE